MKTLLRSILVLTVAATAAFTQGWEFGGSGGGSFLNSTSISGAPTSGNAGFAPGVVLGAYVGGFSQYKHLGGELHYEFLDTGLRIKANGQEGTFSGNAHAIHYDLIFKTAKQNGKVQLFAAVGGGMKIFRGTGAEHASQPMEHYGLLTRTQQLKPMLTVGGGVRVPLGKKVFLRAEVRDFITAFPTDVIAPPPGVKYGKLLNDIVPLVGIGVEM
jgi:hypothetical protein